MKIRSLMILSNLQSLMMQSIIVSYFNIRPPQLPLDVSCLFQHLNKASPDYGGQVVIWTPEKKRKFKIHTGSVFKMAFFFTKEFAQKYKGNFVVSVFCNFWKKLFLSKSFQTLRSICLIETVHLIPILAYFMIFHVIWHMS